MVEVVSSCLSGQVSGRSQSPTLLRDWRRLEWSLLACANNVRGAKRVHVKNIPRKSSQVSTETTDTLTEAYRMCSGSQQGWTGVDGDDLT